MTTPAHQYSYMVGDLHVGPASPVLQRRRLYVDANHIRLPLFGDARWDLSAALPDRHTAGQAIVWDRYPEPFREACKLYAFALVNVVDNPPRLPYSRSHVLSVKTLGACLGKLRTFLNWLVEQHLGAFAEVTTAHLDAFCRHITELPGASSGWKRTMLLSVQRLHAYRDLLPEHCRLPAEPLWGGATAAELANAPTPWFAENRTARIHPDVMRPLLSAALLVIDTIAADLLPAARNLAVMRTLAHQVAPPIRRRPSRRTSHDEVNRQQLEHLLTAFAESGQPLPGRIEGTTTVLDTVGLAVGGWLNHSRLLHTPSLIATAADSGLPITADLLRVAHFAPVEPAPWRSRPVEASELLQLLRHVVTAGFLIIAYLSGVRTGEALNLHRGCISRDATLGLTFLSGMQMKADDQRRERSPRTIPWVVTEHSANAVAVLEQITISSLLFPTGELYSQAQYERGPHKSRTPSSINSDISRFITWFNTEIAPAVGHPLIGEDPDGKIRAPRLRRTLAWHIVRRPGGTVAGATQYGHLHTQLVQGYAGRADAGFLDEISFEQFLLRAETIHDDHQRLAAGEHVSGPAADAYRARVTAGDRFHGLTITTPSQVNSALANPDLQIHHGALITCVYKPDTAACRNDSDNDGPAWRRCRLTCRNIARTDRDIAKLRHHVHTLAADLAAPGLPDPLRQRVQERLDEHEQVIAEHETTRPPSQESELPGSST